MSFKFLFLVILYKNNITPMTSTIVEINKTIFALGWCVNSIKAPIIQIITPKARIMYVCLIFTFITSLK